MFRDGHKHHSLLIENDYQLGGIVLLGDAKKGQRLRIVEMSSEAEVEETVQRLFELGVVPGAELELRHTGPVGRDPLAFEVDGGIVAISLEECRLVQVEELRN